MDRKVSSPMLKQFMLIDHFQVISKLRHLAKQVDSNATQIIIQLIKQYKLKHDLIIKQITHL